ncbi:MAG: hypothetical protein FWD49_07010 [Firmicutes bacterium]|nr:hypothetical protein [Bacillota bacterium]
MPWVSPTVMHIKPLWGFLSAQRTTHNGGIIKANNAKMSRQGKPRFYAVATLRL